MEVGWKDTFLRMSDLLVRVWVDGGVLERGFSQDVLTTFGGLGRWRCVGKIAFLMMSQLVFLGGVLADGV